MILLPAIAAQEHDWLPPLEKADLLLFSAHADDEHLFFAGVLPYCSANGIQAQVVYMTHHNDYPIRNTERLNGLWAVGIHNLPVISLFPDLFSESLSEALEGFSRRGVTEDDFIAFCVENIRRFKPEVVVGHDIDGEYGHGAHMLSSRALMQAVTLSADPQYHSESYQMYGGWDVPKTYINQWKERPITLDIDTPLEFFDGLTAFGVSQIGFSRHVSQHWTFVNKWLNGTDGAPITQSTQITLYPPGRYGLFRTTVGEDSEEARHFFENIKLLKDTPEEVEESEPAELDIHPEVTPEVRHEHSSEISFPLSLTVIIFVLLGAVIAAAVILSKKKTKSR